LVANKVELLAYAIEPATVHGGSRSDGKVRGELHILEHDDQRTYRLAITPHAGAADIAALQDRLRLAE
jgi:hypothetical protein